MSNDLGVTINPIETEAFWVEVAEAGKAAFIERHTAPLLTQMAAILGPYLPEIKLAAEWERGVLELCAIVGKERGEAIANRILADTPSKSGVIGNSQWAFAELERITRKALAGEEIA